MLKNILKLLGALILVGGAVYAAYKIVEIIDEKEIRSKAREEARKREQEAFKAKIESKSVRKVKIGLRDRQNRKVGESFEIESSKGVADNLQVGQEIEL